MLHGNSNIKKKLALLFLDLDISWRCVISFMPRPLCRILNPIPQFSNP